MATMPKAAVTVEDKLELRYVPLKTLAQWDTNVKKHDLPTIIKSIWKHGFKDPLKFEPALNKGAGGIVEGNGRDQALKAMFAQNPNKLPRGILITDKKDDWLVPVLFGVDAISQAAAESYGFDHNTITMLGGELTLPSMMTLFQDQAALMLKGLQAEGQLPVSITGAGLDALLEADKEKLGDEETEIVAKTMLRVLVSIPVNSALDAQPLIDELKKLPGVEVDVSGNG
jgi:hypothetical protein